MPEYFSCSALSAELGEPLVGTASRLRLWLMIEQPGPWGHDALVESGLPAQVGVALRDAAGHAGIRVLLVKRRDRPRPDRRRCFAAFTGVRQGRLGTFEVDAPEALLDLDLPALADARFTGFGEPVDGPLFLVCTHGKHDTCCAREGGPVARALADRPDVWEATHVGGDRFAGNVVCFPHGVYYGRVAPEEGVRIAAAYEAGGLNLERYRGRSCYSPPVQAGEWFLRRELGLTGVDDLLHVGHEDPAPGLHRASFRVPDGAVRTVEVEVGSLDERLLTCKAVRPYEPRGFVLRGIV